MRGCLLYGICSFILLVSWIERGGREGRRAGRAEGEAEREAEEEAGVDDLNLFVLFLNRWRGLEGTLS
jgi:hypothetical protein